MFTALADMALEQLRRGLQEERQQDAVGFGELERTLQGALCGGGIATRCCSPPRAPPLHPADGGRLCPRNHTRPWVRDERPMEERAPRPTLGW